MKISRVRTYLEQHKLDQTINFLWFLMGLAIVPVIGALFGWLAKLPPVLLCILVVMESAILIYLLFRSVILFNRIKVVNIYLKKKNITWEAVESDVMYGEAFEEEAEKETR